MALMALLASAALADVIYLKNGNSIKGTFVGFENNQFIFQRTDGSVVRYRVTDVDRLVMERDVLGSTGAPVPRDQGRRCAIAIQIPISQPRVARDGKRFRPLM